MTIHPMSLVEREESRGAVAVQGVLPLDCLTGVENVTVARSHRGNRSRHVRVQELTDAEVAVIAQQLCRGVAEVIAGERPANQLVRCTSERVYADLVRRGAAAKSRRRIAPERRAHTRVERVGIQRRSPRAVEAFARLRRGTEVHALAARIELVSGRWTCVSYDTDPRL